MNGKSNKSVDNSWPAENENQAAFDGINHEEFTLITAHPQLFSRSCNDTVNSSLTSYKSHVSRGQPFLQNAESYGGNIRPWLKNKNLSDQNMRLNSSDSFIINFDNISEPSTSHPADSNGAHTSKSLPGQFPLYASSVELGRKDDHENNTADSSINIPPVNNNNNNQNQNNSSNNSSVSSNEENQAGNSNLNSASGRQCLDKVYNDYINYVTFLTAKIIYDYREGILIFVGLLITFIHANYVVKREIAKQSRRSLLSLGIIFCNLLISICFIYFVFQDQHLYNNLIFIPPYIQPLNFWDVLWIVTITDFVLKFITIQLKIVVTCLPAKWLPYSSRGKWYLMLESTSQLYRGAVPIQPWLYYLLELYQGTENSVGMFFSVAYVVSKGSELMSKIKLFLKAVWKVLHHSSLGVRPVDEQLVTAGTFCPICHDEYNSPVVLQCKHVFCESCVSTWFDREQSCPLCRAKVADDPSWKDGATSLYMQLF